MKIWISPYLKERIGGTGESRFSYYTRVPAHLDRGWCFLRLWVVCISWL